MGDEGREVAEVRGILHSVLRSVNSALCAVGTQEVAWYKAVIWKNTTERVDNCTFAFIPLFQ